MSDETEGIVSELQKWLNDNVKKEYQAEILMKAAIRMKSKDKGICKRTWTDLFQLMLDGKKNVDVRLADFELKEGDIINFKEYDPSGMSYSGRSLKRKVKNLVKVNFTDFHSLEEIAKYGHWIMELEDVEGESK